MSENVNKMKSKSFVRMIAIVSFIVIVLFLKFYVIGYRTTEYVVVSTTKFEDEISIDGFIKDDNSSVKSVKIRHENGEDKLVIRARKTLFTKNERKFHLQININNIQNEMKVGNKLVLADGTIIYGRTRDLYKAKNKYIGDMSSDDRVAGALEISKELGKYLNSLQTTTEPYGWTLEFENEVTKEEEEKFNQKMSSYAYVLLAMVENVGEISWTYPVKTTDGYGTKKMTVTTSDATKALGNDIKSYAESERKVQELLEQLQINDKTIMF